MLYEKLVEYIKEIPKLNKVYQDMIQEGYLITNISTTSMSPLRQFDFTSIEIGMEKADGERILINFIEGFVNSLSVQKAPSINEKIHPNLLLKKEIIHDKEFKKRVFGGYDPNEVDEFLDLIIKDYRFVEEGLIKEIKLLKEDAEK